MFFYSFKLRKLENKISKIEKEVTDLEKAQSDLDLKLANPDKFKQISKDLSFFQKYQEEKQKIKIKEKQWEDLVLELNRLKND